MLRQSKDREKMCNCMVLDVTAIFFWITAFLKKLPFLAKGQGWLSRNIVSSYDSRIWLVTQLTRKVDYLEHL